jgi:hypothetical protein
MTLAANGVLGGSPAQQATFIPTITVTDSKGNTASKSIELDVFAPLTFSTAAALPNLNIALPASMYIAASGGMQPYAFSLAPGSSMPPGLTFSNGNAVGLIQGTPATPGSYSFTVQVTDSFTPPFHISQTFTLNVLNGLVVPNQNLPDAVQNVPYREQIVTAGGTPPYHFVLFPLAMMPPGLTLDTNTGIVSGTPTISSPNPASLYMSVTDSASTPASINAYINLNVQPPLSIQNTSLADCPLGLSCNDSVIIIGGRSPYKLTISSGGLPPGVNLSQTPFGNTYYVGGVPTNDGTYAFTLKVSDSYETPDTAIQSFQIRVSDQLAITGPGSVGILYNQSYSTNFPVTGGIPPYTWSIETVPPGFTFDTSTGTLSGTGTSGSFTSPNVYVQDSSNPTQHATYFGFVLDVYGKLTILPSFLPTVGTGGKVVFALPSKGGAAPLQWSITSGTLPAGLTFGTSGDLGLISGSATTAGSYSFTVGLSDGNTGNLHQTASQQYTLVVKNPGQMTRNDSIASATPISTLNFLASISPYSDAGTAGPDVDYYSASAAPGSIIQVYVSPNNDFQQPPEPNSLQPVLEIVDATGTRYQSCQVAQLPSGQLYNLPCVNNLPGNSYLQGNYYSFQVPGSGSTPVTFYVRVSDARGDARPDFIYTLSVYGVD